MKPENNFSFQGKSVAIIGGKGKMGQAFAEGFEKVGAKIEIFDRDRELPKDLQTDITLMALSESTTLQVLAQLSRDTKQTPIITTSSTNGMIHQAMALGQIHAQHLTPIHALCGPKMTGSVMIDCTDEYTLARSVALEVARIMEMEIEHVSLKNHDIEIALAQARFHAEIWHSVQRIPDIVRHVSRLPISQRRAFIGNARVLLRPDISAELIVAFPESIFLFQDDEIGTINPVSLGSTAEKNAKQLLINRIEEKDRNGLIRSWVKTENERIDKGVPGGPRSFQEFLKNK